MSGLERRLARIEKQTNPGKRCIFIDSKPGETAEEAQRRHFAQHPEDKDASLIIMWEGLNDLRAAVGRQGAMG